jgi:hypothetical protein
MPATMIEIAEETTPKRSFAWVIDWPGWCRSGKDGSLARQALLAYRARYEAVADLAGLTLPAIDVALVDVVESVEGGSGTAFGVPSAITGRDRQRVSAKEAERLAAIVAAAWVVFDRVAVRAPGELRKGPRGGGRDRDPMIGHVVGADHAYAREIGIRLPEPDPTDRQAVVAERAAVLELLRSPSDGSPLADRRWPQRYAARRIAWHALDHAWEMEDRSGPAPEEGRSPR